MLPWRRCLCAALLALAPGCASSPTLPPATQLQKRELQTRVYDAAEARLVLKAVVNTLLDEGYLIDDSNTELGVITASLSASSRSLWDRAMSVMSWGQHGGGKLKVVEMTANVEAYGSRTRVRLSARLVETSGEHSKVRLVEEPAFYQNLFAKLDKSLFLLAEKM